MPPFKERRKKARRKEDRARKMVRTVIIDMPLDEFVSKHVGLKRSGISIFKVIQTTEIIP